MNSVNNLLEEGNISDKVLGFVGPGAFRFVAVVNKVFLERYRVKWNNATTTTFATALSSATCFQTFLNEHGVVSCEKLLKWGKDESLLVETILPIARSQDPPCPWDKDTCTFAAQNNYQQVIKWLRSQDPPCPWHELSCSMAAEKGNMQMIRWLRSQDPPCPWNEGTCAMAADSGNLQFLQWIRSRDPPCPWDEYTLAFAANNDHMTVVRWCLAQNPPCPMDEHTRILVMTGRAPPPMIDWR